MKMAFVFTVAFLLIGCATSPRVDANWREEGYEREGRAVAELVTLKQITRLDGIRRMQVVAKSYFPGDRLLLDTWEDVAQYAERLEKGEISGESYRELFDARWALFNNVSRQRSAEAEAQEAQQRRTEFIGNFLNNMSRSMQRSNPPAINCATTSMPGVITTNCR